MKKILEEGKWWWHLFCQNGVYSLCHNFFLNLLFLMSGKWNVGRVPFTPLCLSGKLWCGLCDVIPSVSPSRGWLERPCLLLGYSLNRNLIGRGAVAMLSWEIGQREIVTLASVEDVGKISCTVSCVGWLRWVSSLGLWLAGDAGEAVREGCAMGMNSRNKMWMSFEATETNARERRWWIVGKLFLKLFYSLLSYSIHECFHMLVHFGTSFIF